MAMKKKKKKKVAITIPASEAPYVEIVGSDIDPRQGLKINLDWNDAFVDYLRQNGFKGTTDEAIVQLWLTHLYKNMVDKMAETKTNEYE